MMLSSDLSLALTSDTHEDEEYLFVGRRKKTPLTNIPLGRYRARPDHRRAREGRSGDQAARNAQQCSNAFAFHLNSPTELTEAAPDPPPPTRATPSPSADADIQSLGPTPLHHTNPAPLPVSPPPVLDASLSLLGRASMMPAPMRKNFVTSASTVGSNHARAVLAVNRLRQSVAAELSYEVLQEDLAVLRKFEVEHPLQLELWIEAFSKWDNFIRSLFPKSLLDGFSLPLSAADGETLLSVLPSSTSIAYINQNWEVASAELGVTKLMRKLLGISGIAEMAVALTISLLILEAASCAQHYYSIIAQFLTLLHDGQCYKRLFDLAGELVGHEHSSQAPPSKNTTMTLADSCEPRRVSIWSLIMLIADPSKCEELARKLKAEDLFAQLNIGAFDEVMDLVDQIDIEMAMQHIQVYIMTCHGSLSQSIALIRAVTSRVSAHLTGSTADVGANMFTGGGSEVPPARTVNAENTISTRACTRSFNECSVQNRIHKLYEQVVALHKKLDSEISQILAGELGIREASARRPDVRLPAGALLKTLVIFIESIRTCTRR